MNDVIDNWRQIERQPIWERIELKPSSNIESAHYDMGRAVVRVCFKSGAKYDYFGVTQATLQDWIHAPSAGRFLNRVFVIHGDIFLCRKVVE